MPAGFHLTKWYLDAVAPDGSATIGYWARMSWGVFAVRYSAVMHVPCDGDSPVVERTSLLNPPEPTFKASQVSWAVPRLGIDAHWRCAGPVAAQRGMVQELLADGAVRWECLAPVATVGGSLGGPAEGDARWGYAERLTLRIEPWQVPVDELRWGRVGHPSLSVVWIEWRGPQPLCIVYVNGAEQRGARVSDDRVEWSGGAVGLTHRRVIRDATLGDGPVKHVPLLSRVLPARMLSTHETKWLSDAVLPSGERTFAIHEVVRFGGAAGGGK